MSAPIFNAQIDALTVGAMESIPNSSNDGGTTPTDDGSFDRVLRAYCAEHGLHPTTLMPVDGSAPPPPSSYLGQRAPYQGMAQQGLNQSNPQDFAGLRNLAAEWQQAFATAHGAVESAPVMGIASVGLPTSVPTITHRLTVTAATDAELPPDHPISLRIAALEQENATLKADNDPALARARDGAFEAQRDFIFGLEDEVKKLKAELAALKEPPPAVVEPAPFPLRALIARHRGGLITETPRD